MYRFIFLKIRASDFSDFLHEPSHNNCKNVTVLHFGQKFENGPFLAKNGPKIAISVQNGKKCFCYFLKTAHQIFIIFCQKFNLNILISKRVSFTQGKFIFGCFWPKKKFCPKMPKILTVLTKNGQNQLFAHFLKTFQTFHA